MKQKIIYEKIKNRMSELGINEQLLSEHMGMEEKILNQKLNNIFDLTIGEFTKLIEVLKINNPSYFFYL